MELFEILLYVGLVLITLVLILSIVRLVVVQRGNKLIKKPVVEAPPVVMPDLEDLNLSTHARNILKNNGITTIELLLLWRPAELVKLKQCGWVTVRNIEAALADYNLELCQDPPPPPLPKGTPVVKEVDCYDGRRS